MSDAPKPYGDVLADAAKKHGLAGAALALSISALATGGADPSPVATSHPTTAALDLAEPDAQPSGPRTRLDLATDADVSPGATIAADGRVPLGARLVAITGCIGAYDDTTRICVLSPGPWELHSSCEERSGVADATTCTIAVRNTGALPLRFAGYVEVAKP